MSQEGFPFSKDKVSVDKKITIVASSGTPNLYRS